MKACRVAHVLRKYDPAEWGGTETHVVAVTRLLGAHGWAAEVHAPAGPTAPDRALPPEVRLRRYRAFCPFLGGAAQRRWLYANGGNIASLDEPLRLARDRGLALAHVHAIGRIGGAVRTAMRLTGRPYVVSLHGPVLVEQEIMSAETSQRHAGLWDLGRPLGVLLGARRVLDDAARVISFNDGEHAALEARVGRRAVRMNHGVDAARFAAGDAARARARWPVLGDGPVVVLAGRIARQKNQLLAVRAFARGAPPDHRLALAGAETEPGGCIALLAEARALGVADRVHVLGNLDPASEIPDLLALATVVLVPSLRESFGLAVLEGWAACRTVLFARRPGLEDLARAFDDDTITLATLDVSEWAAALARLCADEPARRAAGEAGAALVQARFRWDLTAARLASLYAEVLAERRAP
jgi:glycosyltransferase involved in cell wall biosynthesis